MTSANDRATTTIWETSSSTGSIRRRWGNHRPVHPGHVRADRHNSEQRRIRDVDVYGSERLVTLGDLSRQVGSPVFSPDGPSDFAAPQAAGCVKAKLRRPRNGIQR